MTNENLLINMYDSKELVLQFFKRSFSLNPVNYLVIISSKLFEIQTVNAFFLNSQVIMTQDKPILGHFTSINRLYTVAR